MSDISIHPMAEHEYGVQVREGDMTTSHQVRVSERLRDDLALDPSDEPTLVRESIGYLLDREPGTSIERTLDLDDIADRFPDYMPEIRARLAGPNHTPTA